MSKLELWPADSLDVGSRIIVVGLLWLIDTEGIACHHVAAFAGHVCELLSHAHVTNREAAVGMHMKNT